jgi:hypothetical protein
MPDSAGRVKKTNDCEAVSHSEGMPLGRTRWRRVFHRPSIFILLAMPFIQPSSIYGASAMKEYPTYCVWLSQLHAQFHLYHQRVSADL